MNSLASGAAFVRPKSGIILPYILIAFGFSWAVWMATWWGRGDHRHSTARRSSLRFM